MLASLPFAVPLFANRTDLEPATSFETRGAIALIESFLICMVTGGILRWIGRRHHGGPFYQKEAMAIVGLSWVMATVLGALPYYLSGTCTSIDHPITFIEAMFESQSGFSTTGATVLTDVESTELVPNCILFWRSWTHFLGGLGIVVLFVAILGQGSAGKAMMRAEMPGPTKDGSLPRMQNTALVFASIYATFNILLTLIYKIEGMTMFDAMCHAFGTMATGGFSTYNSSLGQFNSPLIEYTTIIFMILAGTNFTLLYLVLLRRAGKIFQDVEFRTYLGIILVVTSAVIFFGMRADDGGFDSFGNSARYGLFQVVSILTTTGYGTADFNGWNNFGRGILLLLMFVGGCAGSTGGGMKVIRHILFYKILRLEIEKAHRPRVVRLIRISGSSIDDPALPHSIVVYFAMILAIFVFSWLLLVTFEPNETWSARDSVSLANSELTETETDSQQLKANEELLDAASAVAATLNNIGPGLGVVGPTNNYAHFSQGAKLLFVWLMMLGRVEVFSVLVLFFPTFWRRV
ncbi:TrkH family potassium uptake protein [Rubripirellula sp.]|jgi:trk system potassium uptake protein|nr:TrkH family potassium uptake protein [Rubripirellula sp.]